MWSSLVCRCLCRSRFILIVAHSKIIGNMIMALRKETRRGINARTYHMREELFSATDPVGRITEPERFANYDPRKSCVGGGGERTAQFSSQFIVCGWQAATCMRKSNCSCLGNGGRFMDDKRNVLCTLLSCVLAVCTTGTGSSRITFQKIMFAWSNVDRDWGSSLPFDFRIGNANETVVQLNWNRTWCEF